MVHILINSVHHCTKCHATLHMPYKILLVLASDSSLRKTVKVMKPVDLYGSHFDKPQRGMQNLMQLYTCRMRF